MKYFLRQLYYLLIPAERHDCRTCRHRPHFYLMTAWKRPLWLGRCTSPGLCRVAPITRKSSGARSGFYFNDHGRRIKILNCACWVK